MQPRNLAVKALESLPILRTKLDLPEVEALADAMEAALRVAPTFLVPPDLFSDKREIAKLVGLIRLPVDTLFLESGRLALLAMRSDQTPLSVPADSILVWPVVDGCLTPAGFPVREADLPRAAEAGRVLTTPIHLLPGGEQFLASVGYDGFVWEHLMALGELCVLLACRNITTEVIPASEKLNKSRMAKGKLLLREYHVLTVKMSEHRHSGGETGYTHAAPRTHIRRGHVRHLPTGPVWVSPTVVNPGNGWVSKTYELTD